MEKPSDCCLYFLCNTEDSLLNKHTYISAVLTLKFQKAFLCSDSSACLTGFLNGGEKKSYDIHLFEGNKKFKKSSEIHINVC